jgi:WD40 repeat protein
VKPAVKKASDACGRLLVRMIRPTAGKLHGVPDLPPHFVPGAASGLAELKASILGKRAPAGMGTPSRAGVCGIGGVGKTVLGLALAHDPDVGLAFSDGVYWVALGRQPDLVALQRSILQGCSGKPVEVASVNLGIAALREALGTKNCLLVVDDVSQTAHAEAFNVLGPHGRWVITTRDREILSALGVVSIIDVCGLKPELAQELLAEWSGKRPAELPPEARDVARECGQLPLALALVGAHARDGSSWTDILAALRKQNVKYSDHADRSVLAALTASVDALAASEAARYSELAIFPEDTDVPESVIARLWERSGLTEYDARQLLQRFAGRALLVHGGDEICRAARLHDLQCDYLRLVAKDLPVVHGKLLDAHLELLPAADDVALRWARLSPQESYLWAHLFYHLVGAGRHDTVQALVTDVRWLAAKIEATGATSLLTELAWLIEKAPSPEVERIARALQMEAGWLYQFPDALQGLLYNRLRSVGASAAEIERHVAGLHPVVRLARPVRLDEGRVFRGHSLPVAACAYSPDGSRLLSASGSTVREWDRVTGRELRRYEGHSNRVVACAYSPDGTRIVSGSLDHTLREWDRAGGREPMRFQGHSDEVTACAYSPDGTRVLSASADKTLREWDRISGRELTRFEGHTSRVTACAYSPDGTRVLSASADKTLREWDRTAGRELVRFEGHSDEVTACAYSPDGWRVLSGSEDKMLREWDRTTGRELVRYEGHTSRVTACAYSLDGARVLSASADKTLREWDRVTSRKPRRSEGHSNAVSACAYSPDGTRVLSASLDNTLREWDRATGRELRRFEGHSLSVNACAYSSDGSRVLSASGDTTLREWDRATARELVRFEGHSWSVTACAYSPDGTRVLSASHDKTVRESFRATGREVTRFEGHSDRVTACAYSPNGTRVLSASEDKTLREWDRVTGRELTRFEGHSSWVNACAYSPDGLRILSASLDTTLREWDRATGRELRRLAGHSDSVNACAYSPDGSRALSASADQTIKIWSCAEGRCLDTVYGAAAFQCVTACSGHFTAGDAIGNIWLLDCDRF